MYLSYVWIGRPLFRLLVWPGSWYFVAARPVARRASIEYQRRVGVLPADSGAWQAWRAAAVHLRHFADTLLDKALVWTGGLALDGIRREVDPRFDEAVDANRGGVLVSRTSAISRYCAEWESARSSCDCTSRAHAARRTLQSDAGAYESA
jgi:predicted LPLAT superfamily acyltransferase